MANSPFYQIILLGEAGVGKTSLFTRIFKNTFIGDKERVTIGLDYEDKTMRVNDQDVQVCFVLCVWEKHVTSYHDLHWWCKLILETIAIL